MSECPNVKHSGDGRNKARRCRECPEPQVRGEEGGGSGSSSKGRKRARTELLRPSPSSDGEAAVMEMCMWVSSWLYAELELVSGVFDRCRFNSVRGQYI